MIPKIIHYCWFGGKEKPKSVIKMINTWKKHCPDYEIKEWNESNFDININQYCKEAYQSGKWAFVSDVARLFALYSEGGIYLDTDVEIVKSFNDLLQDQIFLGFESSKLIATSCIGAEANNILIREFLEYYKDRHFVLNSKFDTMPNVEILTNILCEKWDLALNGEEQFLGLIHIYPRFYFSPYDYVNGKLSKNDSTYSIHWFSQSWINRGIITRYLMQFYHRIVGIKLK